MNLSTTPYFDDFDSRKKFAKILFKPGPAVQARELNQLQTLLQEQVRRFGDNVLKNGTIVSGGQITHHASLPYVKILDNNTTAEAIDVASLFNMHVRNSAGLRALVVTTTTGLEAAAPDLKTIYVKYLNAGDNGSTFTFAAGEVLTVSDPVTDNDIMDITIAAAGQSPIGTGYGLTIEEGVIYHAGYFTRIDRQLVVVSKYSSSPDDLCVGFDTAFEIVTADEDSSLYDNAYGSPNENAPGADRLKANSFAIVLSKAEASTRTDFLSIVEFTNGEPYKQDPNTQYNVIEQNLARRTFEESGNYVLDRFNLSTKSAAIADEDTKFQLVIDPGVAYIQGYRVATERNFTTDVNKATTTKVSNGVSAGVDYGNYVIVERLNGDLTSLIGSTLNLNDTTQTYAIGGTVSIAGGNIGSARVRGIKYNVRGSTTSARLYLFDINLNAGKRLVDVRSLNGTNFNANISGTTQLYDTNRSAAIFNGPAEALKSVSNLVFTEQRSSWGTVTSNTSGEIALTVTGSDSFEYSGTLTRTVLDSIFVSPAANTVATNGKTGTVEIASASNVVTGTGTAFATEIRNGQWVDIGGTRGQVASVTNNTSMTLTANAGATASGQTLKSFYPKWEPLYILSGSVSGQTMTLEVMEDVAATQVSVIAPVRKVASPAAKSVTRNAGVRINCSNATATTSGPWCLGLPDIIHLRGVYKGTTTTFLSTDPGIADVTNEFYVDSNHSPDTVGLGYLYKKPTSSLTLTGSDRLLAVFDVLSTSGDGFRTIASYPIDDDVTLAASAATINTLELPEVFGSNGMYFDVRDAVDFRPTYSNAVAITTTHATAPINPSEKAYASRYNTIGFFAAPESSITANVEQYLPRVDRVVVSSKGEFVVVPGQPGTKVIPSEPRDVITINALNIPAYPSIPQAMSDDLAAFADTKISNEKASRRRLGRFTISTIMNNEEISGEQPKGYRMVDIGDIDRRVANVEYYLSLTMAENQAQTRMIPSAVDPDADRFKFGFFVDSFTDASLSELANPQYSASVAEGSLRPRTDNVVVGLESPFGTGGATTLPFTDHVLIEQLGVTNGPVVPATPPDPTPDEGGSVIINPPPPPPEDEINPPPVDEPVEIIVQTMTSATIFSQNTLMSSLGRVYEEAEFYLSSTAGQCEMYFNFRDNNNGISIHQGFEPNFIPTTGNRIKRSQDAVDVTQADINTKAANLGFPQIAGDLDFHGVQSTTGLAVVEDCGKITWTHDPSLGRYVRIRVYKFSDGGQYPGSNGKFAYRFFFPIDSVMVTNPATVPTTFNYNGIVGSVTPPSFILSSSVISGGVTSYYTDAQRFRIRVTGLKPSAVHQFWYEGADKTANCVPISDTTFKSNASGVLEFDFFAGATPAVTSLQLANMVAFQTPSTKVFQVKTSDNSSVANGFIAVPAYGDGGNYTVFDPNLYAYETFGEEVNRGVEPARQMHSV